MMYIFSVCFLLSGRLRGSGWKLAYSWLRTSGCPMSGSRNMAGSWHLSCSWLRTSGCSMSRNWLLTGDLMSCG